MKRFAPCPNCEARVVETISGQPLFVQRGIDIVDTKFDEHGMPLCPWHMKPFPIAVGYKEP